MVRYRLERSEIGVSVAGFGLVVIVALFFVFAAPAGAQTVNGEAPDTLTPEETEQKKTQLQQELQELEREIAGIQENVNERRSQARTLEGEVGVFDQEIRRVELQLRASALSIRRATVELKETRQRIEEIGREIDRSKDQIGALLRKVHSNDATTLVELLLQDETLSDFFTTVDALQIVQQSLHGNLSSIRALREDLQLNEGVLEEKIVEHEQLLALQERQRQSVAAQREQRRILLEETRGEEARFQQALERTARDANAVRNQLFILEGGGSGPLTFEQAYEFAREAARVTGIRVAFLLSIIKQESNFGRNVGQCFWRQTVGGFPVMHPTRDQPAFEIIAAELGISPDTQPVSCPWTPGGRRPAWSWGGAMGPAQFIPSTWMGYKDAVGELTGRIPASPWRPGDAFLASALKLKAGGAGDGDERCAAVRYFAGRCTKTFGWYADQVITRAQEIERQIALIASAQ